MIGLDELGAYLQGPWLAGALAGLGLVVGVLTGLFGVGGGFMVTPLLNLLLGIPYEIAVGTSLSFTIGTGAGGLSLHARLGNFEPRSMLIMAGASMLGAWGGSRLNLFFGSALGTERFDLLMHALFIVMLLGTAAVLSRRVDDRRSPLSPLQRRGPGPRIELPAAGMAGVSLPGLLAGGLAIGVVSGLMGVGGGVLLMPLLVLVVGLTPHQAVGTSLGVVVFSATAGVVEFALAQKVSLWAAMSLLAGSTVGLQIGGAICRRLHGTRLRRYFAWMVVLVALALAADMAVKLLAER